MSSALTRSRRPRWKSTLLILTGLLVTLIFVIPYVIMVVGSLRSRPDVLRIPPTYWPDNWHFDNYINMWSTPETPLPNNLLSSVVISVLATLLVLVVALPAAYYTARKNFPGKPVFMLLVLVTQMLQPTALATGLFREFTVVGQSLGIPLIDTWLAMILINAAFNLSFGLWMMHAFFSDVPEEIEQAAAMDGASRFTILRRITLPLVAPGIVTAVIFTLVACWNEFAASLVILTSAENQTLSVAITRFFGQYQVSWQYVFGVSVVGIVPVVILFALIERRLVAGLTAGSVK